MSTPLNQNDGLSTIFAPSACLWTDGVNGWLGRDAEGRFWVRRQFYKIELPDGSIADVHPSSPAVSEAMIAGRKTYFDRIEQMVSPRNALKFILSLSAPDALADELMLAISDWESAEMWRSSDEGGDQE
jgi:hypothetical protein